MEKALARVNIRLRENETTFRPMSDVLDDVAKKWESLNDVEKASVSQAISGTRQRENFIVLMNNYGKALEYTKVSAESAGTALNRYKIYQDSVEAASNRFTASWEALWQKTINSDAIKFFYDLGTNALEAMNRMGGLAPVIETVVAALVLLNAELIKNNVLTFIGNLKNLGFALSFFRLQIVDVVAALGAGKGLTAALTAGFGGAAVTFGAIAAILAAVVAVWTQWNKQIVQTQQSGLKGTGNAWEQQFKKIVASGGKAKDVMEAYRGAVESVNKAHEQGGIIADLFVNKQEIITQGLQATIDALGKTAEGWKEYSEGVIEAAKLAGYSVDEQGRLYKTINESGRKVKVYADGIQTLTNAEFSLAEGTKMSLDSWATTWEKSGSQVKKQYSSLISTLKLLQNEVSATTDIANKAISGKLTFDDVGKLAESYPEYLDALNVENGQIELNTDKIKEYNIAKAEQALQAAKNENASAKEIAVLENYVEQLKRATPLTREYSETFQKILDSTSQSLSKGGGDTEKFDEIGKRIFDLNQMVENGTLSSAQYFEQLETQLKSMNLEEVFGTNQQAAESFFSGLTLNATQSLAQISSMFDAGQISITNYTDQLSQLSDIFGIIGDMTLNYADTLGMTDEQQAKVESSVTNATNNIRSAGEELRQSHELDILVQDAWVQTTSEALQFNTEAYNKYMQNIANAAAKSGKSFTDMSGNALTSAEQIYQFLTSSTGNFAVFANQNANQTGNTIKKMTSGIANLLRNLAESIRNFKGGIALKAVPTGDYTNFGNTLGAQILNKLGIPNIKLDISGEGVSFEGIAGALESFANDIETSIPLNFDANIYSNPESMNQITGSADKASGAFGGLSDSIDDVSDSLDKAGDKANDNLKSMDALLDLVVKKIKQEKEAEKDALKEQLDGYKKIIDLRKDYIDSMKEEKEYQDKLSSDQKDLANIQNEILELQLDDSEEAKAKLLQLQEEASKKQEEINKTQYDKSVSDQKDALDRDYEAYKDNIESKIKAIEDYLNQNGQIVNDAIALINQKSDTLFNDLMAWNQVYGDGLEATVVNAWNDAYSVLEQYKNGLGQIDFQYAYSQLKNIQSEAANAVSAAASAANAIANIKAMAGSGGSGSSGGSEDNEITRREKRFNEDLNGNGIIGYHNGAEQGPVGGVKLGSNEVFAKLMKSEVIVNPKQIDNFMKNTLPALMGMPNLSSGTFGGGMTIENLINIEGNATSDILPDLNNIADQVVNKLNKMLQVRGIVRNASQFSI